jgi:hypothetical protein
MQNFLEVSEREVQNEVSSMPELCREIEVIETMVKEIRELSDNPSVRG